MFVIGALGRGLSCIAGGLRLGEEVAGVRSSKHLPLGKRDTERSTDEAGHRGRQRLELSSACAAAGIPTTKRKNINMKALTCSWACPAMHNCAP